MAWRESWWPQELPTEGELQEGLRNLERYHYEVDYVITHCCGSSLQERLNAGTGRSCAPDLLTDYLETWNRSCITGIGISAIITGTVS